MLKKRIILVHHTAISNKLNLNQFELINESHRRRGFPKSKTGHYGGYQYFITDEGLIKQYREENEVGAHCRGMNHLSIGIAVQGHFELEEPNIKQIKALKMLIKEIEENNGKCKVLPHSYFAYTACPGRFLKLFLKNIKVDNSKEARKERNKTTLEIIKKTLADYGINLFKK